MGLMNKKERLQGEKVAVANAILAMAEETGATEIQEPPVVLDGYVLYDGEISVDAFADSIATRGKLVKIIPGKVGPEV